MKAPCAVRGAGQEDQHMQQAGSSTSGWSTSHLPSDLPQLQQGLGRQWGWVGDEE